MKNMTSKMLIPSARDKTLISLQAVTGVPV